MFVWSINGTSRVVRMTIVGDATTWNVIVESSFTIVMCLYYRPLVYYHVHKTLETQMKKTKSEFLVI